MSRLGRRSLALWRDHVPGTPLDGSLVVAHPRDRADFERFARLTPGHERIGPERSPPSSPVSPGASARRCSSPARATSSRAACCRRARRPGPAGRRIRFGSPLDPRERDGWVIDCRGLAARDAFPELRGVKGETVLIETREIALSRPVRLIHPRWPLYVVPRADGRFLVGATAIESQDTGVSVRSALELLSAAYALHPTFGEARIVELGAGLRPALPDHAPRIRVDGRRIAVNGLYRHGFLLAPALAEATLAWVRDGTRDDEVMQWC